jgi:hypothetical protein
MMIECKGKNCEALYGIGHSKECIDEHEKVDHLGAGGRHPECRYEGYSRRALHKGASRDQKFAWEEGYMASLRK